MWILSLTETEPEVGAQFLPKILPAPTSGSNRNQRCGSYFPLPFSISAGDKEISLVFFWIEYGAIPLECSFLEVSSSKWRVQLSRNTGLDASATLVCCLPGQPLYLFNHIYYIKSCSPKHIICHQILAFIQTWLFSSKHGCYLQIASFMQSHSLPSDLTIDLNVITTIWSHHSPTHSHYSQTSPFIQPYSLPSDLTNHPSVFTTIRSHDSLNSFPQLLFFIKNKQAKNSVSWVWGHHVECFPCHAK